MNSSVRRTSVWLWLTLPIAILLMIAAGGGVLVDGLYRDAPDLVVQAKGQDLVSLALALPTLIVSAILANRGSRRARLVWLGTLTYLVYSYVTYAVVARFNPLFLVYVALLGCSLYALIGGLATTGMAGMRACFTDRTPTRSASIFLAVLAILFYCLWLSEIVPALMAGRIPQSVLDSGTPTNVVHVIDMAWILPALAIAAVSLWRRQTLGYTLAGVLLPFLVLLVSAILAMAALQARDGLPNMGPPVVLFATLDAIALGTLVWYVKGLRSTAVQMG